MAEPSAAPRGKGPGVLVVQRSGRVPDGTSEAPAAARRCPQCHCGDLQADARMGALLCPECGQVVEENSLVHSGYRGALDGRRNVDELTSAQATVPHRGVRVPLAALRTGASVEPRTIREAYGSIEQLAVYLQIPRVHLGPLRGFFLSHIPQRVRSGDRLKQYISALVYIYGVRNKLGFTLAEVAEAVQCSVYTLGRVYRNLLNQIGTEEDVLAKVSPMAHAEKVCARLGVGSTSSAHQQLRRRVVLLLDIIERSGVALGRRGDIIAGAAVCVVMKAHGYALPRSKLERALPHTAHGAFFRREREMLDVLRDMGVSYGIVSAEDSNKALLTFVSLILDRYERARATGETSAPSSPRVTSSAPTWRKDGSSVNTVIPMRVPAFERSVQRREDLTARVKRALRKMGRDEASICALCTTNAQMGSESPGDKDRAKAAGNCDPHAAPEGASAHISADGAVHSSSSAERQSRCIERDRQQSPIHSVSQDHGDSAAAAPLRDSASLGELPRPAQACDGADGDDLDTQILHLLEVGADPLHIIEGDFNVPLAYLGDDSGDELNDKELRSYIRAPTDLPLLERLRARLDGKGNAEQSAHPEMQRPSPESPSPDENDRQTHNAGASRQHREFAGPPRRSKRLRREDASPGG